MMQRREFLRCLGWGLAGSWAAGRLGLPELAAAKSLPPRLALLADAHLPDGNERRPEARALARAVAEIRGLKPAPDLVLFAGDLAHAGHSQALELGREILAGLPGPLAAVRGEGDGPGRGYDPWPSLFGESRFSRGFAGFHLLGLNTALSPYPQGPVFMVGREQRRWLSRELARLDPHIPLVVLSHAPLVEIFRPWRQWTRDGQQIMRLLSPFSRVYCFHGHVHQGAVSGQLSAFSHGLPSTSWPLPSPEQGTPAAPRPGLGPRGCGWSLATLGDTSVTYQPRIWRA